MFVGKVDDDNLEETKPRKVQVLHVRADEIPLPVHNEISIGLDLLDHRHIATTVQPVIDLGKTQPTKATQEGEITQPTKAIFDANMTQPVRAVRDNEITQPRKRGT